MPSAAKYSTLLRRVFEREILVQLQARGGAHRRGHQPPRSSRRLARRRMAGSDASSGSTACGSRRRQFGC